MSAIGTRIYQTKFEVIAGPSRDRLFDAMKYARDKDVDFTVTFTIAKMEEGAYFTNELTVKIDKIQHVDLNGLAFAIDSSIVASGASLKIGHYDTHFRNGRDAELYE